MRVVLTGTEASTRPLAAELAAAGFETATCPLVAVELLPGPSLRVEGYDWLLLTSRNAVAPLLARVEGPVPRVGVVGPGTAEELRSHGIEPDVVAGDSTQEGLAAALPRPAGRVLFAGAEGARDLLVRELGADFVALYRTVAVTPERFPAAELVVLASASAARSFASLGLDLLCVSIGPLTSAAARELGLRVVAEADSHDLEGLVQAVKLAASTAGSSPS